MNFTPDMNNGRNVFVFGSNERGMHSGGAAREALANWGAISCLGFGPAGQSFAIPTMDWELQALPLPVIEHYIARFIAFAKLWPEKNFLVTAIGCGICGYKPAAIAPMFKNAPANCVLPQVWRV